MKNSSIILSGQLLSKLSKQLNLGHGSTWPGHIALKVNPRFIEDLLRKSHTKVIMVAGTNGKTTTARMIRTILEGNDHAVIHNESGANLLNGIASTLLLKASPTGTITADYAIFEVDENALPQALKKITPDFLLILNLFRDQLDRYGEVDTIAKKWEASLRQLTDKTHLILNGDDPRVAYLGMQERSNVSFFGLNETSNGQISEYSADSLFCPNCGEKLLYKSKSYSHLGDWHCPHCHLSRPSIDKVHVPLFPLSGMYNRYNTTAVVRLVTLLHISQENIKKGLSITTPAFGRQEIIEIDRKKIQIFLSKNPTGFNESLRTIQELNAKHLLLVLNDRVADGHDVSWIWDVDFENFVNNFTSITISGDRAYDMAVRIKYAQQNMRSKSNGLIDSNLDTAIPKALASIKDGDTLYVLPTYTAMLEVRKIVKGKKIL